MNEFFASMSFFGLFLSLLTYMIGLAIKKKFKSGLANPLLIAIILTIVFLLFGKIDYETYNAGAKYLTYLLTPSTICLALPLYQQIEKLKKNFAAIFAGILSGTVLFSSGHSAKRTLPICPRRFRQAACTYFTAAVFSSCERSFP